MMPMREASNGHEIGSMAAQVSVLRDKNWKMKQRTNTFSEECTRGFLYAVMTLFGLLSMSKVNSPLTFAFPVQPTPAWAYNCTHVSGSDSSLLLYAPSASSTVRHALNATIGALGDPPLCPVAYPSIAAMQLALASNRALRDATVAAVTVDAPDASSEWSYSIALPANVSAVLGLQNASSRAMFARAYADGRGFTLNSTSPYAESGVLRLVWALNRGLADAFNDGAMAMMLAEGGDALWVSRLPLPAFNSEWDPAESSSRIIVVLYTLIGFSVLTGVLTSMASEREQVEGLKVMGLSPMASYFAWWILYTKLLLVPVLTATFVFSVFHYFVHSTTFPLLYFTLQLTAFAAISFVTAIHAAFPVPNKLIAYFFVLGIGVAVGFGLAEAAFNISGNAPGPAGSFSLFFCLNPYAALGIAINQFFVREYDGLGLTFETLMDTPTPLPYIWLVQLGTIPLYLALTKYCTEVRIERRPWLFFVPPHLLPCCGPNWVEVPEGDGGQTPRSSLHGSSGLQLPLATGVAVRLLKVAKTFYGDGGARIEALTNLSLEMPEQQLTALLGQNGAGKSTAIGVLTGLFPPSSGSVHILGRSVRAANLRAIRQTMGVCPQHDLLFSHLTCLEHLQMFGAIKGVPAEQIEAEAARLIPLVGLGGKADFWADNLSGGQKRKLSVAAAMIGNPKFVLLDEPTAGMDPHSRRAIWDVVRAAKATRTVLLTTHFMDEADALADRIAILSHGAILSTGTPLELKMQYGRGYHLTVACASAEEAAALRPRLLDTARAHVPAAALEPCKEQEVSLAMPLEASATFAPLFESLKSLSSERGKSLSYGLSLPTLQEVFLAILDTEGGASAYTAAASAAAAAPAAAPAVGVIYSTELGGEGAAAVSTPPPASSAPAAAASLSQREASEAAASFGAQFKTMVRKQAEDVLGSGVTPWLVLTVAAAAAVISCVVAGDAAAAGSEYGAQMALTPAPYFRSRHGAPLPMSGGSTALRAALETGSALQQRYGYTPLWNDAEGGEGLFDATHSLANNLSTAEGAFAAFVLPTAPGHPNYATLLYNASYMHSPADFATLLDEALLGLAAPGLTLTTTLTEITGTLTLTGAIAWDQFIVPQFLMMGGIMAVTGLTHWIASRDISYGCKHQMLLMGMDVRMLLCGQAVFDAVLLLLVPTAASIAGVVVGTFPAAAVPCFFLTMWLALLSFRLLTAIAAAISTGRKPPGWLVAYVAWLAISGLLSILSNPNLVSLQVKLAVDVIAATSPMAITGTAFQSTLAIAQAMQFNPNLPDDASTFFRVVIDVFEGLPDRPSEFQTITAPGLYFISAILLNALFAYALYMTEVKGFTAPPKPPGEKAAGTEGAAPTTAGKPPIDWEHLFCWPDSCWLEISKKNTIEEARTCFAMLFNWPVMLVGLFRTLYLLCKAMVVGCPRVSTAGDGIEGANGSGPSALPDRTLPPPPPGHPPPPRAPEDEDVKAERTRMEASFAASAVGVFAEGGDRVRVLDLRKEFSGKGGTTVAVDGLCFGVPAGSCFALLGPNGAGKSTSMSMLTGDTRPTAGQATLSGFSIWTELLAIFQLTGFCPQFGGLWPHLTLRQHMLLYLRLRGFEGTALHDEAARVERAYGLTPHSAKRTRDCSGGTRRKLNAAIALSCGSPAIVFLDEPTTGVDVGTRRFIWDRIGEAAATASVLLTTHYMDEADALADRIGIMARGKMRVLGSPQHLKSRHGGGYRLELKGPAETAEVVDAFIRSVFCGVKTLEVHGGFQAFEISRGFQLGAAFKALEGAKETLRVESYTLSQTTLDQVFLNIAYKQVIEAEAEAEAEQEEHAAGGGPTIERQPSRKMPMVAMQPRAPMPLVHAGSPGTSSPAATRRISSAEVQPYVEMND